MAVSPEVRPGMWIDEAGQLRKGAVPASDPGSPPPKPTPPRRSELPVQTVEVIPGPPGTVVDLRCPVCRRLLFRWKIDEMAESGAVAVEIVCAKGCRQKTVFRLPVYRSDP